MNSKYYKWYDSDSGYKPEPYATVLITLWWDGWNYNEGVYLPDKDVIMIYDAVLEKDCTTLQFHEFEKWMMFKEPGEE